MLFELVQVLLRKPLVSLSDQFLSCIKKLFLQFVLRSLTTVVLTLNIFLNPLSQSSQDHQFLSLVFHFDQFGFESCFELAEDVPFLVDFISLAKLKE